MTPKAARRAWTEPRVRVWWLSAMALIAIAGYFFVDRYLGWRQDVRLLEQGDLVQANIRQTSTEIARGKQQPPNSIVTLDYKYKDQSYTVEGVLKGRTDYFRVGDNVPIHVDPKRPGVWTGITEAPPLWTDLVAGMIVLPLGILLAAGSLLARSRTARLWRDGVSVDALVMDVRQTAMAPRSRFVRCTPADESDPRVMGVYVPHAANVLQPGDSLWVITPAGNRSKRAVAAAWFQ